jgi:hypothetical protein
VQPRGITTHHEVVTRTGQGATFQGMPRRRLDPTVAVAAYENFLYLLWEMETSLTRGTIRWTPETAQAARRRLVKVSADLSVIAARLAQCARR